MRVTGMIHDTHYDVEVKAGSVSGSVKVARLVESWSGRSVMAGPTGPMVTVDPGKPGTVLALLTARGTVTGVQDPDVDEPPRAVGRVL